MTARNAMIHRCVIQRDSAQGATPDDWGDDTEPTWVTLLSGVSCRFWYDNSETDMDAGNNVEVIVKMLMLPLTAPVTADDRIGDVTNRRGQVIAKGPMRIDSLGSRADHLIAKLVEIR